MQKNEIAWIQWLYTEFQKGKFFDDVLTFKTLNVIL